MRCPFLLLALGCGLSGPALFAAPQVAVPKPSSSASSPSKPSVLPQWTPDTTLLAQLEKPWQLNVEDRGRKFEIRLPQGCQPGLNCVPGGTARHSWDLIKLPKGSGGCLIVEIMDISLPSGFKPSPEPVLKRALQENVRRFGANWKQGPTELGLINGLAFARARWSVTIAEKDIAMHGATYAVLTNDAMIHLEGVAMGPDASLALLETSLRTFKLSKKQK